MTGTMYLTAILLASRAAQKQSLGVAAATIGIGAAELRPNNACSKSACLVLVGSPVEGPPRCMSQTPNGISTATASPIASVFSAMPGPDVVVIANAPPYAAPIAEVIAASSSSAWNVITPQPFYCESSSNMSEAVL